MTIAVHWGISLICWLLQFREAYSCCKTLWLADSVVHCSFSFPRNGVLSIEWDVKLYSRSAPLNPGPDTDQSQNLTDLSLTEVLLFHKIWFKSDNNFLRYPGDKHTHTHTHTHRERERERDRQTGVSHYLRNFVGGGNKFEDDKVIRSSVVAYFMPGIIGPGDLDVWPFWPKITKLLTSVTRNIPWNLNISSYEPVIAEQ